MHLLNVGKTDSGKTTFTADHVLPMAAASKKYQSIVVYDKRFSTSPRWKEGHDLPVIPCSDLEVFSKEVFSRVDCIIVADEIGMLSVKEQEDYIVPVAATGRHLGHSCIFMAQRANMIRPSIRGMTGAYIAFYQSPDDVKALRGVHDDALLDLVTSLDTGEFVARFGVQDTAKRGRLF